jgi:hypothetical protein
MDFHLEFKPKPFPQKINHRHRLLLIGSCFTENIGSKLKHVKFDVLQNPNGILFNPLSIVQAVNSYIDNIQYTAADLFYENESWNSWDHHSRFSHPDQHECLRINNESQHAAHQFLKTAEWILVTVGSAFVYELSNGSIVANCHKVPTDKFNKKLLTPAMIADSFAGMLESIFTFNPAAKIIFTISPVRHLRDGFVENNRSKASLIQAIHQLTDMDERLFYFPAYELVIDDLRDYRFYAEDMVHPNYAATNYVWEKFITTCIDEQSKELMKEINAINAAKNHKPFNPASEKHKIFLHTHLQKTMQLKKQFTHLNLEDEIEFFKG